MCEELFENFFVRHPALDVCRGQIAKAFELLKDTYDGDGKVLVCGNGGSASDSEHIVGELMKGFALPRPYISEALSGKKLQRGLMAISLASQSSLISAVANDNGADLVFAQQVLGYGRKNDSLIALSTSGNSPNVVNAARLAEELGLHTIGFAGGGGGLLAEVCDVCIAVPAVKTYEIQEYHLPVYHLLCLMLECRYFGQEGERR